MAEPPRKRDPEQTRAALLDAATGEFARYGFDGARVERIVREAGCNMRMLYHYYGSKENLYVAVLEAVYRDIRARERELELTQLSPRQALVRLVRFTWRHFRENRIFIDVTRNENLVGGRYVRRSAAVSEMSSPLIAAIEDTIARGLAQGVFRHPADPLQLYVSIVALCSHHLANVHTLSAVFSTDLADEAWLADRLCHVEAMVLRLVGAPEAADDGLAGAASAG